MKSLFSIIVIFICVSIGFGDVLGLVSHDAVNSYQGYTLFNPNSNSTTYLINNNGEKVHEWENDDNPGQSVYLLPDGNLLRTFHPIAVNSAFPDGGAGGGVALVDWDGTVLWEYIVNSMTSLSHHDVAIMPSGNVLIIVWDYKTSARAIANGRNPSLLDDDALFIGRIIEVEPTGSEGGNIVWQWSSWDHIIQDYDSTKLNYGVISENPGKIDINRVRPPGGGDWLHINAVNYNASLDQIVLSINAISEIFIIDHSTADYGNPAAGIALAAGEAGDLIYRWGNPFAYGRGAMPDKKLYAQHDAQWIEAGLEGEGNILIFNNGQGRTPLYSSIVEIEAPVDAFGNYPLADGEAYGPEVIFWEFVADPSTWFYSSYISGAQRLPNGNTLICSGASGFLFEVTNDGDVVWEYRNPVTYLGPQMQGTEIDGNHVFRCYRYPLDFEAFDGRDLTPYGPIELYEAAYEENPNIPETFVVTAYPNPFNASISINCPKNCKVEIFDIHGHSLHENMGSSLWQPDEKITSGVYMIRVFSQEQVYTKLISFVK